FQLATTIGFSWFHSNQERLLIAGLQLKDTPTAIRSLWQGRNWEGLQPGAISEHATSIGLSLKRQRKCQPFLGKDVQVYLYKTFLGKDVQVYLYKTFLGKDVQVYLYKSTETRLTNKVNFSF